MLTMKRRWWSRWDIEIVGRERREPPRTWLASDWVWTVRVTHRRTGVTATHGHRKVSVAITQARETCQDHLDARREERRARRRYGWEPEP